MEEALNQGYVDYVLIYPVWGGDEIKKRADITLRQEMVFSVFKEHSRVLVTRLDARELQETLTLPGKTEEVVRDGKSMMLQYVRPKFEGMKFTGFVGSDKFFELTDTPRSKELRSFMRGLSLDNERYSKHAKTTIGAIIALPVTDFIVGFRADDQDRLRNIGLTFGDRRILAIIACQSYAEVSSSKFKDAFKAGKSDEDLETMVQPSVLTVIRNNKLYSLG